MTENNEIMKLCSDCFKEHGFKCVAIGQCSIGKTQTLEDYRTEYRLYDKAISNEMDIEEYDSETGKYRIVKFSEHKHREALTVAIPLENGFIIKKKICVICREVFEVSIYQDAFEHVRLTDKLKMLDMALGHFRKIITKKEN
jgi:hypothetical protein